MAEKETTQIENNEKYIAVSSYITPAGWLVAYMMKLLGDVKTEYCIFHLRQGLGQVIVFGALWITMTYIDSYFIEEFAKLLYVVTQIIGIIGALNGEKRVIPILGVLYKKVITFIK